MDRQRVEAWIEGYERAWRHAGVGALDQLFTPGASYRQGPFQDPVIGLHAIGAMWEEERLGPDEAFTMIADVVAVEGSTAVVRVEVAYGPPLDQEFRDLWVLRFGDDGRCLGFEEWPFLRG